MRSLPGLLASGCLAVLVGTASGQPVQPPAWPAGTSACATCHAGATGPSPRLAGLPADYLVKQLRDLRDGERPMDLALREAHALDREAARRLAQALATLPPSAWPAAPADAAGERLYLDGDQATGRPACQVCHGNAQGLVHGMSAPPLQGQPRAYLVAQLRAWRDLRRRNSPEDLMTDVARGLSDTDIEALAAYLGRP